MNLPLKVLNRLRLGRDVAAEVTPRSPNNRAWVVITPLVREGAIWTHDSTWEWAESRLPGEKSGSFIVGYRIVRIEVSAEVVARIHDDDLPPGAVSIEKAIVASEEEIGTVATNWISDISTLRHPANVADVCLVLFRLGPRAT